MSNQRRHDKTPSKQHRAFLAPVSGYPGHDNAKEFHQTGRIDQPASAGASGPDLSSVQSHLSNVAPPLIRDGKGRPVGEDSSDYSNVGPQTTA